jgi:hypothetical protein
MAPSQHAPYNEQHVEKGADMTFEQVPTLPIATGGKTGPANPGESLSERLLRSMRIHVEEENESVQAHKAVIAATDDPAVKLLLNVVLEDEERHHGLLQRMAESFHEELTGVYSSGALPSGTGTKPSAEAIETVKTSLQKEHDGVHKMRQIAEGNKALYGGLFSLLIETMVLDSQKHEHVLAFTLKRLEGAAKAH